MTVKELNKDAAFLQSIKDHIREDVEEAWEDFYRDVTGAYEVLIFN